MRKTFTYEGKRYGISAKSEAELKRKIASKKKELQQKSSYIPGFSEWYNEFLNTYKIHLSDRTYESYEQRFKKHLQPYFKNKKLPNITHLDCQKFLNGLRGYSQNTIHKLYYDLKSCFDMAVINGYIENTPMKRCLAPSGKSQTRRAITSEERQVTLKVAEYHPSGMYILFMLFCGLRPHEASYIQGKDLDDDVLHVRGTKSAQADRWVPIPQYLLERLPNADKEEYLIKSITGIAPISEVQRRKSWCSFKREMSKYMNVANDLVPYCYRHTYCTDLQDAGIPINVAREFMGHSTIDLTARIYTHRTEKSFNDAKRLLNLHTNLHTYDVFDIGENRWSFNPCRAF